MAALALAVGCGAAKVDVKVGEAKTEAVEAPKDPPPKKKKKCESLAEQCEGEAGSRVRIAHSGLSLEPVTGWMYAQEVEATVVQIGESGPAMSAAGYDAGEAKAQAETREAALGTLAGKIGVTLPKKKIRWNKPLEVKDVGALKVSLWQVEGATRGDKKGPLLVFGAPLEEGKALLGIAFVPDDETSNADASILTSIETIAPAEGSGS